MIVLSGVDSSDDECDLELQLPRQRLWPGLSSDEEEEHDFELVTVYQIIIWFMPLWVTTV